MKTNKNISEDQRPMATGFDFDTTSAEVMKGVILNDKVVIVTGGYSGIGLETVRQLHGAGATVIIPTRNLKSTQEIFNGFSSRLEIEYMDLMNPESIDKFVEKFVASGRALHVLINNAGIMASPLSRDARGYESQLATNHLGHFQLTLRLWKALKKADGARVINVSSLGHRFSDFNFDDPNFETTPYERWKAYGQSKTANVLFSVELDRIGKEEGIRSYALHPGRIIDTNLKKFLTEADLASMGAIKEENSKDDLVVKMKTIDQGAATTLFCATSALLNEVGGVYCEDSNIAEVVDDIIDKSKMTKGVFAYAVDKKNAKLLWQLSCQLIGMDFSIVK